MDELAFDRMIEEYLESIRANRAVPRTLEEAALYAPLDHLLNSFIAASGRDGMRAVQQARTDLGIPDFVIDAGGEVGYIEAKKPSTSIEALGGRDRKQQESFLNLPNLIYTNYREFLLFEDGRLEDRASLGGMETLDHRRPAPPSRSGVEDLRRVLTRFVEHRILPPRSARDFSRSLARATRVLHDAVLASLRVSKEGPIAELLAEWRRLLLHELSEADFADAYAQTVSYGLLTARLESSARLSVESALEQLDRRHTFLGAAMRYLTLPAAREEVGWAVRLVVQVLDGVSSEVFRTERLRDDPLLYFYEDFLRDYDPVRPTWGERTMLGMQPVAT